MDKNWWMNKPVRWHSKTYKDIFHFIDSTLGDIPFHVARQLLYPLSTQRFVDLLNTPTSSKLHIITNCEESFRLHEIKTKLKIPFFTKKDIFNTVHNEYDADIDYSISFEDFEYWVKTNIDYVKILKGVDDDEDTHGKRLTTELQQVEELKQALADSRTSGNDIEGHGLCSLVIRMRQEGKTDEDIAEFLDASGCSNAQIGVLLHTDPEASKDARTKLAQRLLGKA